MFPIQVMSALTLAEGKDERIVEKATLPRLHGQSSSTIIIQEQPLRYIEYLPFGISLRACFPTTIRIVQLAAA
jgi:hypothetical protein